MNQVEITINGNRYQVEENITILEAAQRCGQKTIPTLCHEKRLGQISSCYICSVKVEGSPKLLPSCSTLIKAGMVIETENEEILQSRKECLSLLLSDHRADCISPCNIKCPAGIDVQGYLRLSSSGFLREAAELIREKNPLPIVCGRVCVRPCELVCRRELIDETVAIDTVKRSAAELTEPYPQQKITHNGKTASVIGSGPAGLSYAYYMSLAGYKVTVYEKMPKPGGMLRYGIPEYRLPKHLLDKEIDHIKKLGVIFKTQKTVTPELFKKIKENSDFVFIGCGAWKASDPGISSASISAVSGIDFLREVTLGQIKSLKGMKAAVVGGGNTAIDSARTALRLGAKVKIIYRRTLEEMPAHHEEIEAAEKEGANLMLLTSPKMIIENEGQIEGLQCIRMELGEKDASGRRKPVEICGSEFIEQTNLIIAATGQYSDLEFLDGMLTLTKGQIAADKNQQTSQTGIYAGGDAVTGPSTVIEAIAAGRKAAMAVIEHNPKPYFRIAKDYFGKVEVQDINAMPLSQKAQMRERRPLERVRDFKETEQTLSPSQTEKEARRCLRCGCNASDDCLLREYAAEYPPESNYTIGETIKYLPDISHPNVILDPGKCIKCTRCIKTCEKINGISYLGLKNRGFATTIVPEGDKKFKDSGCVSCGNCIGSCPTGALTAKNSYLPFYNKQAVSHCLFCNSMCEIDVKSYGRMVKISSARDKKSGEGDYTCEYGATAMPHFYDSDRITETFARNDEGVTQKIAYEDALSQLCSKIQETSAKYGPESVGIFLSPLMPSEIIYSAVKLGKGIIGTNKVLSLRDFLHGQYSSLNWNGSPALSTASFRDLINTDVIILTGDSPTETVPGIRWMIREAVENGATLVHIGNETSEFRDITKVNIKPQKLNAGKFFQFLTKKIINNKKFSHKNIITNHESYDSFIAYLEKLKDNLCPRSAIKEIDELSDLLTHNTPKIMALYDSNTNEDFIGDIVNLLIVTDSFHGENKGLLILEDGANCHGTKKWGAWPGMLPGFMKVDNPSHRKFFNQIWKTEIKESVWNPSITDLKMLICIGEDLLEHQITKFRHNMDFIATFSLYQSEFTKVSNIIFPITTLAETGGFTTQSDLNEKYRSSGIDLFAPKSTLDILSDIAARCGYTSKLFSQKEFMETDKKSKEFTFKQAYILNNIQKNSLKTSGKWLEQPFRRYIKYMRKR